MSYDEKYRRRALEYSADVDSMKEAAEVFKVNVSTLYKWKSQLKETGTLAPKKRMETYRKIDPEKLKRYNAEHPDAYLEETATEFGCTEAAVRKAFKRLGITRKKNHNLSGAR